MADTARRLTLSGHVQGVGFRPFVYRLAVELGVRGWVRNVTGAVVIHAEADVAVLAAFAAGLIAQAPAIARPALSADEAVEWEGHAAFAILPSETGKPEIHVPPDYFTCQDCLAELADPQNRRYGYPFINCTQCGPRYTLITALPYDRPNTSMAGFPLCPACAAEYTDPTNRRFHAEPVACPVCGPHLEFVSPSVHVQGDDAAVLAAAVAALKTGQIVAVKGIGGYHLMCDATSDAAIKALRTRKPRPGKPLAVLFPDVASVAQDAELSAAAESMLTSPARPIVLLPIRPGGRLSPLLAPGLREVGCFLAYAPLHQLLLNQFGGPLVATSGNVSGEPVLTRNDEAASRLAHIAGAFVHHDRPIVRPADDSVFRPLAGRLRPIRLGRGIAPLELVLPARLPEPVLALGAHTKNTLCLAWDDRAVVSPHLGDLDTARAQATLAQVADDLQRLYQVRATRLLMDRHPGYGYRAYAREAGLPVHEVWHHHAHASALAGEFPDVGNWLVFAWDGVGLGEDGTLWGGEAFVGRPGEWQRRASFRPFRLPGGEKAGREPWRSAAALRWEAGLPADFAPDLLHQAWKKGLNSPETSAVGRLFDAAAALIGACTQASFEGEGPMRIEALAASVSAGEIDAAGVPRLPMCRDSTGLWRADWSPLLPRLDDGQGTQEERAWRFHAALVSALVEQAVTLRGETGATDVGLCGGVFQNRVLADMTLVALQSAGFTVHLPERVPANDAGVSFGQVIETLYASATDHA